MSGYVIEDIEDTSDDSDELIIRIKHLAVAALTITIALFIYIITNQ